MMGQFGFQLFGQFAKIRTDYDAHAAATAPHSATSAATASRLMLRDANGRAQVADPAVAADIATRGWVLTQLSGLSGTVSNIATGTGLTGGPITTTGTISLANTAVSPGSYTYGSFTVDAQGRLTAASSNTPVTSLSATAPLVRDVANGAVTISINAATTSLPGSMSAADKTKLDGIGTGANVTSVFGRTGVVTAQTGDYTIQKISGVTISSAAPSGGADGDLWFKY